jgi:type IV pilus assembly protein PilN
MRLDINLASRPYEDARGFWMRWGAALGGVVVVTLVLLFFTISGWLSAQKDRSLIRQTERQIAERDAEMQSAQALLGRPDNQTVRDRSQALNDLFERKAFSWTRVFEDLERVMPPHLHLVSIHPEMSTEHQLELKLMVAGESRDRAIEMVRNMEGSHRFQQARITEENDSRGSSPGDNTQAQISAQYVPDMDVVDGRRGQ